MFVIGMDILDYQVTFMAAMDVVTLVENLDIGQTVAPTEEIDVRLCKIL